MEVNSNINENEPLHDESLNDENNIVVLFADLFNFFLVNKKLFIRNLLGVAVITTVILLLIPNKYKSTTSFIAPPGDLVSTYTSNDMPMFSGEASFALPKANLMTDEPGEIYAIILKSRQIKENIINKFNLKNILKPKLSFGKFTMDDQVRAFNKWVNIKNEKGIIYVAIESEKPQLSSEIANEYVKQLSMLINKVNLLNTINERVFLGKRLEDLKIELKTASDNLAKFQVSSSLINIEKQSEAIIKEIGDIRTQIIISESELDSLLTMFNDKSTKVIAARAKIDSLKNKLRETEGKSNNPINGKTPKNRDVTLLNIPVSGTNFFELARTVSILDQVFIGLTKKYELSKVQEAKGEITLKVIDPANVPIKKSKPMRTLILIGFLLVTFFFTLGYVYLKFRIQKIALVYPETYQTIDNLKSTIEKELIFWKKKKI